MPQRRKPPTTRANSHRKPANRYLKWVIAAVALLLVAGTGTWLLWPDSPRQREYLDATACLLTDKTGVNGADAKNVWAAMQKASITTKTRVQNLPVAGPQTPANARAHANSLAGGRCGLVIAVGPTQVDAVTAAAPGFPHVRFIAIGDSTASTNLAVVRTTPVDAMQTIVNAQLTDLAESAR